MSQTMQRLKNILLTINGMTREEALEYHRRVYDSKEFMNKKAFDQIVKALEIHLDDFVEEVSPIAVCAEIEED